MLLVVRGDLRSETGWSRATRALISAIEENFSAIAGVDLHWHPERSKSHFPWGIIDDTSAGKLMAPNSRNVVLHATLPDGIVRIANAINLGWWFWETDRYPSHLDWPERVQSLDHALVPSPWQAQTVRRLNPKLPVTIVPWPHGALVKSPSLGVDWRKQSPETIQVYKVWTSAQLTATRTIDRRYRRKIERVFHAKKLVEAKIKLLADQATCVGELRARYDGYFFAVQSDAPRKGLPVLIREWCRYRAQAATSQALLVRFSCLNVDIDPPSAFQKFTELALGAARGDVGALEHVYVILDEIPARDLSQLYTGATAYVSSSFGEGFGGTLVEAAQNFCPLIAPRHTACAQLIPSDYLLGYSSIRYIGPMIDRLNLEPANGSWHIPEPGEICARLRIAETLSDDQRQAYVELLGGHMSEILAPKKAADAFLRAVREVARSKFDEDWPDHGRRSFCE